MVSNSPDDGKEEKKEQEPVPEEKNQPKLPSSDFYTKLLHLPPCKTGGECNNCGRCEH